MGKLLQKLVHGIVPSWLTKIKSTSPPSRKPLPYSTAGANHVPSSNSPVMSNNSGDMPVLAHVEGAQQDGNSSLASSLRSSSMPRKEFEAEKVDSMPQHEASYPNSVHAKKTQAQPKQGHGQSDKSGHHNTNLDAVEPHGYSGEGFTPEMQQIKELWHTQESIHSGSHEAQYGSEHSEHALYQELLRLKSKNRKSVETAVEHDEEGEQEEGGSRSRHIKSWAWKKRRGEQGILSCELPESICSIVGNGKAVLKQSLEPHRALWESMVEMIVGNGLHELGNLEFLLYCYLSLNEPHVYPIIQASFLQVLKDLERIA